MANEGPGNKTHKITSYQTHEIKPCPASMENEDHHDYHHMESDHVQHPNPVCPASLANQGKHHLKSNVVLCPWPSHHLKLNVVLRPWACKSRTNWVRFTQISINRGEIPNFYLSSIKSRRTISISPPKLEISGDLNSIIEEIQVNVTIFPIDGWDKFHCMNFYSLTAQVI